MLHIDIHSDETGETIRVGSLGDFADLFVSEIGSVATVLFKKELRKKALSALDRIVQRARDEQ